MKQVLSKDEVAKVMREMLAQGKRVTLNSLHAALNHRGSMTTLVKLKAEVDSEAQPIVDSTDGLRAFREVWALAVEEGRKQQEEIIAELREEQKALITDNERLDGIATAAESQAGEFEAAKSVAEAELVQARTRLGQELKETQAALLKATEQAKQALETLTTEQARHAEEVSALRSELASEVRKSHESELALVRAQALLEARSVNSAKAQ
jgi:hypothetical protein